MWLIATSSFPAFFSTEILPARCQTILLLLTILYYRYHILHTECNDSFHLACANLEALPDGSEPFYCPRCTADKEFFSSMSYTVDEQFEEV